MTQAFNLSQLANFVDSSGQLSAAGLQSGIAMPSGTLMLFQQTSAPTGWTKQTTHNNKALRVVTGTAGSGGTTAFTSVFANQTPTISVSVGGLSAGATTLSTTQMPSHKHRIIFNDNYANQDLQTTNYLAMGNAGGGIGQAASGVYNTSINENTGGGGSHSHSISGSATGSSSAITLDVQYVDLIIASKN